MMRKIVTRAAVGFLQARKPEGSGRQFGKGLKTARWGEIQGRTIVGIAAGLLILGLLYLTDSATHRWALSIHTPGLDALSRIAKNVGHTKFPLLLMVVFYSVGRAKNNARFKRVSLLIPASVLLSGLIVLISKPLFGRVEVENMPPTFKPTLRTTVPGDSVVKAIDSRWGRFPSGDSAVAFATAGAVAVEFPGFAPFCVLLAALAALGRVYSNVHMASDVFAGGWLGWAVARWVARRFEAVRSAKATLVAHEPSRQEKDIAL